MTKSNKPEEEAKPAPPQPTTPVPVSADEVPAPVAEPIPEVTPESPRAVSAPVRQPVPAKLDQTLPALQSLLQQHINASRTADQQFYLVILPEDGELAVETFGKIESLSDRVIELMDEPHIAILPFLGQQLPISNGPNRFLKTPFGVLPLYKIPSPDELEFDESGYLGNAPEELHVATSRIDDEEDESPAVGPPPEHVGRLTTEDPMRYGAVVEPTSADIISANETPMFDDEEDD